MNESTDPALSGETSQDPASGGLTVHIAQKSDVGLVRTENQDFAIVGIADDDATDHGRGKLMIVADGMGGHRGGATASRLAATIIKAEYLSSSVAESVPEALRHALESANARIFEEAQSNPDLRGMGTTCSALVIRDGIGFVAHVGDSRIYLVRGDEVRQLTQDHSLVASMVREGLLTTKEAEVHPRRNVLQRSMGVAREVEIDVSAPLQLKPLDTFILCSDGLHGLVKEDEMREVVRLPIEEAAREFVQRAISRGAPDNVTVIVARVDESVAPGHSIDSTKTITDKIPTLPDTVERPLAATAEKSLSAKTVETPSSQRSQADEGRVTVDIPLAVAAPRPLDSPIDSSLRDAKTIESARPDIASPAESAGTEVSEIGSESPQSKALRSEQDPAVRDTKQSALRSQPSLAAERGVSPKRSSAGRWIVVVLLTLAAVGAAVMVWSYQNHTGIFKAEEPLKK